MSFCWAENQLCNDNIGSQLFCKRFCLVLICFSLTKAFQLLGTNLCKYVWTNLCYRECFRKTNFWQKLHFDFFLPKFEQKCAEPFYVVVTHHRAKANLEKGSSWPPEAISYEVSARVVLDYPNAPTSHLGPNPRPPIPHKSGDDPVIR